MKKKKRKKEKEEIKCEKSLKNVNYEFQLNNRALCLGHIHRWMDGRGGKRGEDVE